MKILESFGGHAKRVVPSLQQTVRYFRNEENNFPKKLSLEKAKLVEESIERIEASTDMPNLIQINL